MTNNKKAKERECLNSFLLNYNQINKSSYKELNTPDEDEATPLNVDFLCADQLSGKIIAIEITGFLYLEKGTRDYNVLKRNVEAIEEELKGKVKGDFSAIVPDYILKRSQGTRRRGRSKIVAAIKDYAKSMKKDEEIFIKAYQIKLKKFSDDGDVVGLLPLYNYGEVLGEFSKKIKEKNLTQLREAKEKGYETFLLIDDQGKFLRDHSLASMFLKDYEIASIPSQAMNYIDHIVFITKKENQVSYIR